MAMLHAFDGPKPTMPEIKRRAIALRLRSNFRLSFQEAADLVCLSHGWASYHNARQCKTRNRAK